MALCTWGLRKQHSFSAPFCLGSSEYHAMPLVFLLCCPCSGEWPVRLRFRSLCVAAGEGALSLSGDPSSVLVPTVEVHSLFCPPSGNCGAAEIPCPGSEAGTGLDTLRPSFPLTPGFPSMAGWGLQNQPPTSRTSCPVTVGLVGFSLIPCAFIKLLL